MDATVARCVAQDAHAGQLTRAGEPLIEHVERVAGNVPARARTIAYLHDVLERSGWRLGQLRARGLTDAELAVLELLTREPDEPYELHVTRIAEAGGRIGALARIVKLADLEDHLSHPPASGGPDYAAARRRIAVAAGQRAGGRRRRSVIPSG